MRRRLLLLALAPAAFTTACSDMSMNMASDLGVTQGGSQDIALAREIIEAGGIPNREHFSPEGLFSEHDLPLDGADCETPLCARAAAARIDPVDGSGEQMLVQLGFGTMFQAETFERRPLNLSIAVDVSGSMSGEKIETVREAMTELVDRLGHDDTLSLVAFDNRSNILLRPTAMDADGRAALRSAIAGLEPDGGTDIEAGLADAFALVAPNAGVGGVEDRVMLLTDAQPNLGDTHSGSFQGMVRYYSAAGIGTSVFGVGMDLGSELAIQMSNLRGGNSFFLADSDDIRRIFDEEFDYLVTPLGYDLDVEIAPAEGLFVGDAYATPTDPADESVVFGASTLFLSARAGGMGLTLTSPEALPETCDAVEFSMTYETAEGDPMSADLTAPFEGGTAWADEYVQADDLGVYKMAYLIDEILAMNAASAWCEGNLGLPEARLRIRAAGERLASVAEILGDDALASESALMTQLLANIDRPAPDCWAADAYYY